MRKKSNFVDQCTVVNLGELFGQNSNFRLLNFILLVTHNESAHYNLVRCTPSISIVQPF